MKVQSIANRVKDAALEQVAKWIANRYHLTKLGRITDLRFDSAAQQIFLVLDLLGEQEPIELMVHYQVLSPTEVEITDVHASREWMTALVNQVIPAEQKRLTVSPTVSKLLSKLVV
jgi:hypothetical protein